MAIALDYSVLDHLQRIHAGNYNGRSREPLERIRAAATGRLVEIWITEITLVEMVHGIETADARTRIRALASDAEKQTIAEAMFARKLGYPCSRTDDTYSRLDISFRPDCPDWARAYSLERRLLAISGVSPGDARQLVSCAFPLDSVRPGFSPQLDWLVAEDNRLIKAVIREVNAGNLPELADLKFGTSEDVVVANPGCF